MYDGVWREERANRPPIPVSGSYSVIQELSRTAPIADPVEFSKMVELHTTKGPELPDSAC